MEPYRIANFVMQVTFLIVILLFILRLAKRSVRSPVWTWFAAICVSVWFWVAGRFLETIAYLFIRNNAFYVFTANFQFIGLSACAASYLMWNMYLASLDKIADSKVFRLFILLVPVTINVAAFTNASHKLLYTKLVMGEPVGHGPLFMPLLASGYALLFAGFLIAARDIFKKRERVVLKLLIFSAIPFFPAIALFVRMATKTDLLDVTPIVNMITFYCLYLVVFKYQYVNISAASIDTVMAQTAHSVCLYEPGTGCFTYLNQVARERYPDALTELVGGSDFIRRVTAPNGDASWEQTCGGFDFRVTVRRFENRKTLLITTTDLSEYNSNIRTLTERRQSLENANESLMKQNSDIDAYIGALNTTGNLRHEKERLETVYTRINATYEDIKLNLMELDADEAPGEPDTVLSQNIKLSSECLSDIRETVRMLKK